MERTTARRAGTPRPKPNMELLRRRMELGLSREDVGRLAGVSGKQVGLIERGVARRPREQTLRGIADALSVSPLALIEVERRFQ